MIIPSSKYIPFFRANADRLRAEMELIGDILIIERLVFPEMKIGSLFIADSANIQVGGLNSERPSFFRVLSVGAGYYDSVTATDTPIDINIGDIIYTPQASVKLFANFPLLQTADSNILGLTRHGDVQIRWKSEEKFLQFLTDFNDGVKDATLNM